MIREQKAISLCLVLVACSIICFGQSQSTAHEDLGKMNWLLGNWSRTNAKPGKSAFENWTRRSETEWIGIGVSMTGPDTTFVEKLKIIIENNRLYYIADVPENRDLIYFEMTTVTENGFVCENPMHDFPKKIEYQRKGDVMNARVSAGDKGSDFLFRRNP